MKKVIQIALFFLVILVSPSLKAQYEDKDYPYFIESRSDGVLRQHPAPIVSLDSLKKILKGVVDIPEIAKRKQKL